MIKPRKTIRRLKRYQPPLEGRAGKDRLDFNENTVGCAPGVIRALRKKLNGEWLSRYPEYDEGRRTLARHFRVSPDEMVLANGTDDALKVICETFIDPGDLLLIPVPTFPVYKFFASVQGACAVEVRYDENFNLPMDRFMAALKRKPRWVAIANPNNPTGTIVSRKDLRAILRAAPHTLVLVDEAYYDFSGQTVLPWIPKYPNLIVTRTFSKAFGLAALRMGCIFANRQLAETMRRGMNPFSVNALALACAVEATKQGGYVKRYVAEILANRAKFCRALDKMGISYAPSSANFVLTRMGEGSREIALLLRRKNILVRDWSYESNLRGYLRFTVGSNSQTRRLIVELRRLQHLMATHGGRGANKRSGRKSTANPL